MRIVLVSEWFSEKMGYAENFLPKALADLGHEVHLITSNVQPYFNNPDYETTYFPFIGPAIQECGKKDYDGYVIHRLEHRTFRSHLVIKNLLYEIKNVKPQVVQTFDDGGLITYQVAAGQLIYGYKLFLETHRHASAFPPANQFKDNPLSLKWQVYKKIGHFVSSRIEKCYPISPDAAEISVRFFGIDRLKIEITPLGVDTAMFKPITTNEEVENRKRLREQFGFSDSDLVCIYTGRFSEDKNPLCLAKAVEILFKEGVLIKGLFLGAGAQSAGILNCDGCFVHPFVPATDLPNYYRAADIGVWPRQESTSQIDAAACGLPTIISDQTHVSERIAGNGLTYIENDQNDLAKKINLLVDPDKRREMGAIASKRMVELFSWESIAKKRISDYLSALN
jgi:glycosyltransferase involved in cell wall biosynthesis